MEPKRPPPKPPRCMTGSVTPKSHVSIRDLEADAIRDALREYNCNISKVSRTLGISRSTVYRKMREIGINRTFSVN